MLNLEMIRTRCRELLEIAIEEQNETKIRRLTELHTFLQADNCLSTHRNRDMARTALVVRLDFPYGEMDAFLDHLDAAACVPGLLYCSDETEQRVPVPAILDPEIEHYYQFSSGIIFKVRYETEFYYLSSDGRWIYDGGLERQFIDSQYPYTSLSYKLLPDSSP